MKNKENLDENAGEGGENRLNIDNVIIFIRSRWIVLVSERVVFSRFVIRCLRSILLEKP